MKDESDYVCFHDVDMLPLEADYSYCTTPTHLATQVEQFGWTMPYPEFFGGVTLFDRESFIKVNGFSNNYWGWGCEDDDLRLRCLRCGLDTDSRAGRFRSLHHERTIVPFLYEKGLAKLQSVDLARTSKEDGLSDLQFEHTSRRGGIAFEVGAMLVAIPRSNSEVSAPRHKHAAVTVTSRP